MDVQILIQGLILFVSSGVYKPGLAGTGAAVAIHAQDRPGTYGVDLPPHVAELLIEKEKVRKFVPSEDPPPLDPTKKFHVVTLDGMRIQLGTFDGTNCKADDPRTVAGAGGTLNNTPDLTTLGLPSTRIRDGARPLSTGDYSVIKPEFVSGWLDMLGGTLTDDTPSKSMAEFRPSKKPLKQFEPALGAKWTVKNATAPCLVITPFQRATPLVVVFDSTKPLVKMTYRDLPVQPAPGHAAHGRIGASYDYELLYDIFDQQPDLPPVPHHLFKRPSGPNDQAALKACNAFCDKATKPTTDPVSGVNCGGGGDPTPGDPKP